MPNDQPNAGGASPMYIVDEYPREHYVPVATAGAYKHVLLAGTGGVGDTWICVRSPSAAAVASASETPAEEGGQIPLYAVKIPSMRKQDFLPQEITALQHVASIPAPTNRHIQKYVDHDQSGRSKDANWLASEAVIGCTLLQMIQAAGDMLTPLPKPLVLTIALQLCDALQALRDMDSQFSHGDLALSNIMLDLEERGDKGAPTVVVIDFGRGHSRTSPHEYDLDLSTFYRVVGKIAELQRDPTADQDPLWDSFVGFVASSNCSFDKAPYETFRTQFQAYGNKILDSMSEEDGEVMDAMLKEASKVMLKARAMAKEAVDKQNQD
ncbi:uncharacterized protein N0V89_006483 [Didymosphaeria variabile]|uniref:EKC/KEOPS complex subunit BUD32 n=1 Tax=Didymosphaeria variabile TaxID=1932322 RepID=A0A9W9C8J2_9PLEO|nr:uncharacterized protein N0V89_006483 [Didymosphaeria variabile]KAJ4351144.1 hypothetical protein N0V89_006483 [Didymosphaeria variabile]